MLNRFREVLASFESHKVRYVVIGGIAAGFHGVPRMTLDLDILIEATPDNARRLLEALIEAGLGTATMTSPEEVLANVVTSFQDRIDLDVQTKTPGLVFDEAWKRRETFVYQGQKFFVVSKEDLIASKLAAGRPVDLGDVRDLRQTPDPKDD